ncbi:phage terminase small subunit P27 family [Falsochrobactrum shanghaiense]|uniref:Phage terminase small subunit P27 family n=1 Tax=Falsochrobactrum shanghaiense TaxID=2201899 RepID=A0A316JBN7_9HYPH|nr:P27 family phage terminase small subunit [Falsochrobactrum shanghaiense]PWL18149.1 phage terminase small subunit P27 family [Falsochrobactrum shanghaiense]
MKGAKPRLVIDNDAMDRVPAPPAWLSKEAKAEWRRVMPGLIERRILTNGDLGSLENYCTAMGRVRQLEDKLQGDFDAVLFRAQDKAMTTARQLAAELGLTPVSRSRPAVRKASDGDEDLSPLDI